MFESACKRTFFGCKIRKPVGDEGGKRVAVLTLVRTFIGFIFKIRYHCTRLLLPMGLAGIYMPAMVSAGSRFVASIRVDVRATGTVWKVRACGKRVVETYDHQHAPTVLQTLNKLIAATNKEPCLAGRA